jgi:light-regulated signal transduction histidine kinase (bacteriophytochrome)
MVRYQNDALKKANQELEGAQDLLKASNEDLRTFAYIVSHDLKEPLRMINSYTQLLKRSFKDNLDEDTSQFMFFIIDGSRRMKQMLDDLLQYATAANKEVFKEVVNIKDPISIAIKNLEIPIKEKNANVEFLDDNFPNIHASFSHMTQLFQNLIGNAIKFHKPTMYPLVEISSERKGKYNIIRVQDNGMGIPREKTDSIFSPFERVGHNKIKGTGIGLAICKKIVENHNGKIWVESDTDEGATFYIAFPIEKPIEAEENLEDENL